ncbi:MAG: hypothetical protein OXS35_00220 [Dehalococcoidia bacterium]|nr:hypothetical protein [Dehalococcoidia bacterium]
MKLEKIIYAKLNAKQKEIYNFQKLAGRLADYGFNCIKLHDDWQGADFLAYHKDGERTLKIQLKGRLAIAKKYQNKDLHMAFRTSETWYLVPHDELVRVVGKVTPWLQTVSWKQKGHYSSQSPSKELLNRLSRYALIE